MFNGLQAVWDRYIARLEIRRKGTELIGKPRRELSEERIVECEKTFECLELYFGVFIIRCMYSVYFWWKMDILEQNV